MPRWMPHPSCLGPSAILLPLMFVVSSTSAQDATILPAGQVGKPYSTSLSLETENAKGQLTWKLSQGTLPPGLQATEAGTVAGTPQEAKNTPYVFELTVSDSSLPPQSATLQFSLTVAAAPLRIKGITVSTGSHEGAGERRLDAESKPRAPAPETTAAGSTEAQKSAPDPSVPGAESVSAPLNPKAADPPAASDKQWGARAIVGYHQAGASSAKFSQNFFFDFFIMRALSSKALWEKRTWNLWGDVRIASSPQQVTTGVGTFITNFATQVSNVPVNQLAQSADFQTGLEYGLHTWEPTSSHRMLGLIGYFGALGTFEPPESQMEIFNVPDKVSLQYLAFAQQFPAAANAKYVGFVPPNRERFYRSYGLGFRLTTFEKDAISAPPATYTLSIGEDETITGGIFRSVVSKIDVFYPLPLSSSNSGKFRFIFLFGTANLRLSKATNIPTFALQNPNASGTVVQPFDPNLAIVTIRSTRDTYRIGAGVDLLNLMQTIKPN